MTWRTHWMIGLNSIWLLTPAMPYTPGEDFGLLVAAASLSLLSPDLDASESRIKHLQIGGIKPFYIPAQVVYRTDTHRGMLHSLTRVAFISLTILPLAFAVGWLPWVALILGYASHLLADACTTVGIRLGYPRQAHWHLLPKQWRITTGSQIEENDVRNCCYIRNNHVSQSILIGVHQTGYS